MPLSPRHSKRARRSTTAHTAIIIVGCAVISWLASNSQIVFLQQQVMMPKSDVQLQKHRTRLEANMLAQKYNACQGKEQLIYSLLRVGAEVTIDTCRSLAKWSEVTDLYGEEPVIYGLDRCESYRASFRQRFLSTNLTAEPRVSGMMNTGTNNLVSLLQMNFQERENPKEYSTTCYSKHASLHLKQYLVGIGQCPADVYQDTIQLVLIRDPFRWMNSMCKLSYSMSWQRGQNARCPNLVPSSKEKSIPKFANLATFNTSITYPAQKSSGRPNSTEYYDSLIDMWSSWNRQYFDSDIPRIMIRFEDMIFHAETVLDRILDCLGGVPANRGGGPEVKLQKSRAKHANKSSDFESALTKYGHEEGRYSQLTKEDYDYMRSHVDLDLMNKFHYKIPAELQ